MRSKLVLGLFVVATFGAILGASAGDRLPGDLAFSLWVQDGPLSRLLGWIARPVFRLDENRMLAIGVFAALALMARRRFMEALAFLPVAATTLLVPVTKGLVDRPRPSPDLVRVVIEQHTPSFPSAHVYFAVVIFGAMFYFADRIFGPWRWLVFGARILLVGLILDVSLARIYRGAHWASDVAGAYLMGALALFVVISLCRKVVGPMAVRYTGRFALRRAQPV